MWSIVLLHNRETYVCDFGSKYDSQNEKGSWIYLPANFTGTSSAAYRPMEKILIKITILHLYNMDAIYEDKN